MFGFLKMSLTTKTSFIYNLKIRVKGIERQHSVENINSSATLKYVFLFKTNIICENDLSFILDFKKRSLYYKLRL